MGMAQGTRGLRYAEGSVTITENNQDPPVITHNLGTKKVIALWWAESGTQYASYNRVGWQSLINWWDIVSDDYYITANAGNASQTDVKFNKNDNVNQIQLYVGNTKLNPYSYPVTPGSFVITNDTLQLWAGYYNRWFPGTYHYIIIALE